MTFLKAPFRLLINTCGKHIPNRFTDPPVLIGGCGRSGTTLLLSVLSAHHELFCHPKELGIFNKAEILPSGDVRIPKIHRFHQSFLLNKIPKTAKRWCEKSPSNIRHIGKIDHYTKGKFRFIEIVRDGRDVILSRHPTAPDRYWVEPERWIKDVGLGLHYHQDERVHTIRYEDLINDYENTIEGICGFLGIELTEELLNWHEHARVTQNRAFFFFFKKISRGSV